MSLTLSAHPFPLSNVRLTGGPLKAAQDANVRYLLQLDPDGFLNPFRRAVGLQPRAPVYGGWESRNEGCSGEMLGHYLTAASCACAVTGDPEFKRRVDHVVDELETCQNMRSDGLLLWDAKLPAAWEAMSHGEITVENPYFNGIATWYRIHKTLTGLMDAQQHCGSDKAIAVACRLADWACNITRNLTPDQWQVMLEAEAGGVNEALADLSARTGETKYLELAQRFYHQRVCNPLADGRDELAGLHANTQIPKVVGEARIAELTGDPARKRLAEFFWEAVVNHHSYPIGGNSTSEHFGKPDRQTDTLSAENCETCNTYNMQKLTRRIFSWEPQSRYGDWYERALYNHILGSQDPETGMMCYFMPLQSEHVRTFSTPFDSFWCCVATGLENHLLHGAALYYRRQADCLWVHQFAPSEVDWPEAGVTLRQETDFPADGRIALRVVSGGPSTFTLSLRRPAWAVSEPIVTLNGSPVVCLPDNAGFLQIHREWAPGDWLEAHFPMSYRFEPSADPGLGVLCHGPLVMSADLDRPGPGGYQMRPFAEIRHQRTATYFRIAGI